MNLRDFNRIFASIKQAQGFKKSGFEYIDVSNGFTDAYMFLNEDIAVHVSENGRAFIMNHSEGVDMIPLSEEDSLNWRNLAEDAFIHEYEGEIEEKKRERMEDAWFDFQDSQGEYERHIF
ncbi:hypothetical protein CMU19_04255 [Elizabethkingia anophelis]|nr:hypothetical protein [Elizabethkingia anophelis]